MAITAQEVNTLRLQTGAGMMDCKKALVEAEGDFEKAVEILRKKGQKIADNRGDRDANEGSVFAMSNANNTEAIILEINCETDFVARNNDFQGIGTEIARIAQTSGAADIAALKELPMGDRTIGQTLVDAMGRIGEKIDIRKFDRVSGDYVFTYIHPGARVGVLVGFSGVGKEDIAAIGKDVAMQVAAMKPIAIDKGDVDTAVADKELEIAIERYRAEGKPENILHKIALGSLEKFFKEVTLLNQEFVKDPSKTVAQYLKEANPNLKVKAFKRVQLGQ